MKPDQSNAGGPQPALWPTATNFLLSLPILAYTGEGGAFEGVVVVGSREGRLGYLLDERQDAATHFDVGE